jgi:uncharacterized membrane protein YidH (DUF202 family)
MVVWVVGFGQCPFDRRVLLRRSWGLYLAWMARSLNLLSGPFAIDSLSVRCDPDGRGIFNSTRPSVRAFLNSLWLSPIFMVSSLWFYVWFPCYATARISDLSWCNRASHEQAASSNIARHRAYLGRVVSVSVIVSNVAVAIVIIGIMNVVTEFLTVVLFTLLGFNILLHVFNVLDMILRLFLVRIPNWLFGSPPPALELRAELR